MKKLLVLITLVAVTSAYSQGTVNFNNRVTTADPAIVAPIGYAPGGPATAGLVDGGGTLVVGTKDWGGINAKAALYGGAVGTAEDQMVLLVPAVGFRAGAARGYVNVGAAGSRTIDTVPPGGTGVFQVRAWDGGVQGVDTYEAALALPEYYAGVSAVLTVGPLGGGSPPLPAANLTGLEPFDISYVPEPSIIGLGILGTIAGLLVFRRRQ